ncbi:MAG: manganese efflux pump MntP family protein [Hydrogenoanaerobacterium sp.]
MDIISLFLLAVGLSMDAFAVAVTDGLCMQKFEPTKALKIGLAFGAAQGIMPVLGYFAGRTFSSAITNLDHWVALVFLCAIGGKMIYEAVCEMKNSKNSNVTPQYTVLTNKMLLVQAIATSIDALAVGVSLAMIKVNILTASLFISCTTFILSFAGVVIGKKSGEFLKTKAELAGGVILVLLGIKIFLEHTFG